MPTPPPPFAVFVLLAMLPWGSAADAQSLSYDLPFMADVQPQLSTEGVAESLPDVRSSEAVSEARVTQALDIGAIAVVGLSSLNPGDFADVIEPHIGKCLDAEGLEQLAGAIAGRAQARGFAFATAWIAPQQLQSGVLQVHVDEGRIDEIRLQGKEHAGVRAALAPLLSGKPVGKGEIERRLLIAGDIDGVRIVGTKFLRENRKGVLVVEVKTDRVRGNVTLSNDGTRVVGPEQVTISVDINSLIASDDAVTLTWSTTPFQPNELQFGRIRYEKRISESGTEVSVAGALARIRPGSYLAPLSIKSRSWQLQAGILQPLWRRKSRSLWMQTTIGVRDLLQTRQNALVRDERIVTASASLYGYTAFANGRLRANLSVTQGLGIMGASGSNNPFASRLDADGEFTAMNFWSDWTGPVAGPLTLRLALQAQIASEALPVSEEFGLGGTSFVRGYDWFERSGDEGVMGMAELRYAFGQSFNANRRAELYAFFDGGTVSNRASGFGGGSLASTGGGIRADVTGSLGANLELAVPLTGARNDTSTQRPKFNFRLSKNF